MVGGDDLGVVVGCVQHVRAFWVGVDVKRTVLRVVGILSLVAIAMPVAALPASATKKPKFPAAPESYLPATVGGLTVIRPGGVCPPDTFSSITPSAGGPQPQVPFALALGGICQQVGATATVPAVLGVFSPEQVAAQQANLAAGTTTTKSPHVTKKNVFGIKVEVDQYTHAYPSTAPGSPAGTTVTYFTALGTPVKAKIVQAVANDEATALAEFQTMLQAAQGKVPRLAGALVIDPATSHCAQHGLKSPVSTTPSVITFENRAGQTLRVSWFDFTGALKHYGDVAPGGHGIQPTYLGHVWQVAALTGQCVQIVTATDPTTVVTVGG